MGMVDYQKVRSIAEAEKLRMRKWVISSLLDSEEAYLEYLNTLLLVRSLGLPRSSLCV